MWKIVLPVLAALFAVGSGGMVGGFSDVSPDNEGVQNAINVSVVQHNKGTNDMYLRQVSEVVSAQRQVVAGMNYVITVRMAKTSCRKDRVNEECAINTDPTPAQTYLCTFTVWSRPWENSVSVKEKCN